MEQVLNSKAKYILFGLAGLGIGCLATFLATHFSNQSNKEITREANQKGDVSLTKKVEKENAVVSEIKQSQEEELPYSENIFLRRGRRTKILVIGELSCKKKYLQKYLSDIGIDRDRIVFEDDIDKLKNNQNRIDAFLKSDTYTDIIFGPVPHSMAKKSDYPSLISRFENLQKENKGPNIIRAISGNDLKLTKSSFETALINTYLYKKLQEQKL